MNGLKARPCTGCPGVDGGGVWWGKGANVPACVAHNGHVVSHRPSGAGMGGRVESPSGMGHCVAMYTNSEGKGGWGRSAHGRRRMAACERSA